MPLARAADLIDGWRVVDLDVGRPFGAGYWPFNPSVHYCDRSGVWRCIVRMANYTIPGGRVIAPRGATVTRNVMLVLDPSTWQIDQLDIVRELDSATRIPFCASQGFEDVRLFALDGGDGDGDTPKLYGVACALQFNAGRPGTPEQVLVEIDPRTHAISSAMPMRGAWSYRAQKNWVPFDGQEVDGTYVAGPRFLYSIDEQIVLRCAPQSARVTADNPQLGVNGAPYGAWWRLTPEPGAPSLGGAATPRHGGHAARAHVRGPEVKLASRTSPAPRAQEVQRRARPGSDNLRGGSQLVRLGAGTWMGIGHEMLIDGQAKLYWHTLYMCDDRGVMQERSAPFKLADASIEFAAGFQISPDGQVAISFGTDDHEAHLGVAPLEAVLALLRPVGEREPKTQTKTKEAPWI